MRNGGWGKDCPSKREKRGRAWDSEARANHLMTCVKQGQSEERKLVVVVDGGRTLKSANRHLRRR